MAVISWKPGNNKEIVLKTEGPWGRYHIEQRKGTGDRFVAYHGATQTKLRGMSIKEVIGLVEAEIAGNYHGYDKGAQK